MFTKFFLFWMGQKEGKTKGMKQKSLPKKTEDFDSVPTDVLFSNQMLEDLDKIWALRDIIPDPNKIE